MKRSQPHSASARSLNVMKCLTCKNKNRSVCGFNGRTGVDIFKDMVRSMTFEDKQVIYDADAPGESFFAVTKGAVRLTKPGKDGDSRLVGFLLPGDYFGFRDNGKYYCMAEAVGQTKVCRFSWRELNERLGEESPLAAELMKLAEADLVAAAEHIEILNEPKGTRRVAAFLLRLSRNFERRGLGADHFELPLKRKDIGNYLGLAHETVSRAFTELRKKRLISIKAPRSIALTNRAALQAYLDNEEPMQIARAL